MAPEFFPFIAFAGLAAIALIGLLAAIVLLVRAQYSPRRRRALRILSAGAFGGVVMVGLGLFLLGVNIRQQNFLNEPLVLACEEGHAAEAERLLARGASPDSYGPDFVQTALIAASDGGHTEIVALLLRKGAHLDLKDSDGKTALERARERGHSNIVVILEEAAKKGAPKT
jgi:Ankyrin repeats (3 copies)